MAPSLQGRSELEQKFPENGILVNSRFTLATAIALAANHDLNL